MGQSGGFTPNERQRQAIEHVHGPMLVVAGAGTGKTTVLAHRIAYLIADGHARADEIVALTYTDAAAVHLKKKTSEVLGRDAAGLQASTFHAYGNNLLMSAGRGFGVLDEKDVWVLLRRRLSELPLRHYQPPRDPGEFLDALMQFFSRCQDELVDAARYRKYVEDLRAGKCGLPRVALSKIDATLSDEAKLERCAEIAAVFQKVEEMFAAGNQKGRFGTFGDMITGAVRLLREDATVLAEARKKARFLLIDEFQDANVALIELSRLVAGEERNVFAVGDPDQAIYRFRGASSAAFDEFLRRFPNAKGVILNENQRSTSHILGCAHAVVCKNPEVDRRLSPGVDFRRQRLISGRERRAMESASLAAAPSGKKAGKHSETLPLFAEADEEAPVALVPQPVSIVLADKHQEATDVAEEIAALHGTGWTGSIAVIYRLHAHADEIAYELAARGIPAVVKGIDALETPEGGDLLAALGAVASLSNVDDIFRVSAFPMFGVEAAEVSRRLVEGANASYATLLASIPGGDRVVKAIDEGRSYAASVEWQTVEVTKHVVREFQFNPASGPVARICKFIEDWRKKAITEKGTLEEFVEYMNYFRDAGGKLELTPEPTEDVTDPVQLMTAHAAKGREFDRVFVLRANPPSFPGSFRENIFEFPQALREMPAADDTKELHNQEERRLFYVAMTRAKDYLSIYARAGTNRKNLPTGFTRDIMSASALNGAWTQRQAREAAVGRIEAAAAPQSGVANWMLAAPMRIVPDATLSATAIEAYDTCPLKFKLSREWRIPGPVSAAMLYGNVMHAVLRDYHEAEIAGRVRDQVFVVELFEQMMAEARFDDPIQARLYREQGARQLAEYVRLREKGTALPVVHAEQNFEIKISGVRVRGRIDRVDDDHGHRRIVDFKTGKAYDQRKAEDSIQLGIYALAARELWGEVPQALVIYNLEDNSETVSTRTSGALASLECKVEEVADGIRQSLEGGFFEARPEFHCKWCDFRSVCPAREQRLYSIARGANA